jgi:hypothetical protein
VLGIDAVWLDSHGNTGEGHDESVPTSVEGQVAQRPFVSGRHRGVVQRVWDDPLGRALEDGESLHFRCDCGPYLEAARPGADKGEPGPANVDVLGPASGVEGGTGKGVHSVDLGHSRQIQRSDRADDEATIESVGGAVRALEC